MCTIIYKLTVLFVHPFMVVAITYIDHITLAVSYAIHMYYMYTYIHVRMDCICLLVVHVYTFVPCQWQFVHSFQNRNQK